jgi:hypothetical protein
MRTRPLSPLGDYTIGQPWYVNNVQAVEQSIGTRLKLWLSEWFLDTTDGTPYLTEILGERYNKTPDAAIKRRILGTPGVKQILSYSSSFSGSPSRILTVNVTVQTIYSVTPVSVSIPLGLNP